MRAKYVKHLVMVCILFLGVMICGHKSQAATLEFEINDSAKKTVTITEYDGDMTGIRIPETVEYNGETYTITEIGDYVFEYDSKLKVVEIPDSIVAVGKNCFYKCDNLVQVRFEGTGIRTIDEYAFYECKRLESVTFGGAGLQTIGEYAFFGCALTSFEIPSTVTTIGRVAFGYAKFSSITIPGSVTSCGDNLFCYSTSLKKITFGEGIKTLWESATGGCDSITTITLPSTLETIEKEAFPDTLILQELVIPKNVTTIQDDVFEDLTVNVLRVNAPNIPMTESKFAGLHVNTVYCYYNSDFYKHYIEDSDVKVILIDNPMVITNPSITMGVASRETVELIGKGNIVWKSSNKKIATVSNKGVVTAKKKGKVTITATCDGKTATCKIKVKANERKLKSYSKKPSKYEKNLRFFKFSKVKRDSKGNYIVSGHFINTTKKAYSKASVSIYVFQNSSRVAGQSFSNVKIKSKPRSVTPVKFKIKKKYVEKYTNLCNGNIYVEERGIARYK